VECHIVALSSADGPRLALWAASKPVSGKPTLVNIPEPPPRLSNQATSVSRYAAAQHKMFTMLKHICDAGVEKMAEDRPYFDIFGNGTPGGWSAM
jgi:hypothetical protein